MDVERNLLSRRLDAVTAAARGGDLEGQELAGFRIHAHGLALDDDLGLLQVGAGGLRHVREHSGHVLEVAAVDADLVAVAMDLDAEAIQLGFDRGRADLVDNLLAAGHAGGLGHADGIADLNLSTSHGVGAASQIVAGRLAEVAGQVVGALDGLAVGLVTDAGKGEGVHERGIADAEAQTADGNAREVAVGTRIQVAQQAGDAGDLAFL